MPIVFRFLVLAFVAGLSPFTAAAQQAGSGATVAFGSLKADPTLPVEVTSDQLNVDQTAGTAIFTGNVVVIQGEMRLTAPVVQVDYAEDRRRIARLHATGGVTLVNAGEAAESDEAVYTIDTGNVVMTGNVLLTQGTSALSGNRLTVDLTQGTGVMDGRVQTVFLPGSAP
jgi:lipopolysaccharide export system protein LptA